MLSFFQQLRKARYGEWCRRGRGKDQVLSPRLLFGLESILTRPNGDDEINRDGSVVVEATQKITREVLGILAPNNVLCDPERMRREYLRVRGVVRAPPDTPFRTCNHIVCDLS